ncbi:MAG TPA: alcohol dehydrogenase catalytic domain-containing protein [Methylomirabilota bacterium]|nr:alcohol dehydrogenase catalytic domain-containing protein [Methylomirabilota bacterium]
MRAAVSAGRGSAELREWPTPVIGPGELLLRLKGCGLCGSDIAKIVRESVAPPAVFGHEVVGEVVEVGKSVEAFRVADRVVAAHHVPCFTCHYCRRGSPSMCRQFKEQNLDPGGFAEYIRVPAPNVRHATFLIPDERISDEEASFTEPLACCLRAVKRSQLAAGDSVLVVGLGSIGLMFVQLVRRLGCLVLAAETIPARQAMGRDFHAIVPESTERAPEVVNDLTHGRGVDCVMVTAGGGAALQWGARMVRDGGQLHLFAGGEGAIPVPVDQLYHRELMLTATYSSSPAELGEAFELICHGDVAVNTLMTHRLPLSRLGEAVSLTRSHQAMKVFITGELA